MTRTKYSLLGEQPRPGWSAPLKRKYQCALIACGALWILLVGVPWASLQMGLTESGDFRLLHPSGWLDPDDDGNRLIDRSSVEIWARGPRLQSFRYSNESLQHHLTPSERQQLRALCGRCLYHTLTTGVTARAGSDYTFVTTGDIPYQWLRDSSVQLAIYMPRLQKHPALTLLLETALKTLAFFSLQDPYANAFNPGWVSGHTLGRYTRALGKGGWVWERKYELDSGAYYLNYLWNFYNTPGIFARDRILNDTVVFSSVLQIVKVWQTEQHHEHRSTYRFPELPRDGRGARTNYTGMSWSGFRPSDDANTYGYNIPGNMYAAAALDKVLQLNDLVWQNAELARRAAALQADIRRGIETFGIVTQPDGSRVYAYEVDGLGHALVNFDDPNVPSLLSIPLLGYNWYDPEIYQNTRRTLLSKANTFYWEGSDVQGMGSPHTPTNYIWPLAHMVQALTTRNVTEQATLARQLLRMQCGNGLMHESISVRNLQRCTRPVFEWANSMLVVMVEQLLGEDCDDAAHEQLMREKLRRGRWPQFFWWWVDKLSFHLLDRVHDERLEAKIQYHS